MGASTAFIEVVGKVTPSTYRMRMGGENLLFNTPSLPSTTSQRLQGREGEPFLRSPPRLLPLLLLLLLVVVVVLFSVEVTWRLSLSFPSKTMTP